MGPELQPAGQYWDQTQLRVLIRGAAAGPAQREVGSSFAGSVLSGRAFHNVTVPSELAEASRLSSGLKATLTARSVCPSRVRVSWPVAAFHTLTVPSSLAETSTLQSGLNSTLVALLVCPLRVRVCWPVSASQSVTV
jgi:hypothetical protein